MEKHYLVTWQIDEFADSPEQAAKQALERQRNPESIATIFTVVDVDDKFQKVSTIDVLEDC